MGESMNSFVTEDGEYGSSDDLALFDRNDLTTEQWENLGEISDTDRIKYVQAILEKDDVLITKMELDNFGEHWGLD